MLNVFFVCFLVFVSCKNPEQLSFGKKPSAKEVRESIFAANPGHLSNGFDYPVGKPDGKGYYSAQDFGVRNKRFGGNYHLGEDWNGLGGGNTDYGDPVYSAANGYVVFRGYGGRGWGDVIRVVHGVKNGGAITYVETVYGHVSKSYVSEGDLVRKGDKIAEIGDADGVYPAHLHFELRSDPDMELGGGYASNLDGFLNPKDFIKKNR